MSRIDGLSVSQLEQLLAERRTELSKLVDRRDRLAADLAECEARISALDGGRAGRGRRVTKRRKPGRGRVRNQPALKNYIIEALQKSKKPLSLDDVIEKVQAAGYKSHAGNFRQVAYLNLFNMKKKGEVEHDSETKLYRVTSA